MNIPDKILIDLCTKCNFFVGVLHILTESSCGVCGFFKMFLLSFFLFFYCALRIYEQYTIDNILYLLQ